MSELKWPLPDFDPNDAAAIYTGLLRDAPGHVEVWARIEEGVLRFFTVMDEKGLSEQAVYDAEMQVIEQFGHDLLRFDVYPDTDPIKARLEELVPLLQLA